MSKETWILLIQTIIIATSLIVSIKAYLLAKKALVAPLKQSIHTKQTELCLMIYGAFVKGNRRMVYTMQNQGISGEFKSNNIQNVKGAMGHGFNEAIKLIEENRPLLSDRFYGRCMDIAGLYLAIEDSGNDLRSKIKKISEEIAVGLDSLLDEIREEMGIANLGDDYE